MACDELALCPDVLTKMCEAPLAATQILAEDRLVVLTIASAGVNWRDMQRERRRVVDDDIVSAFGQYAAARTLEDKYERLARQTLRIPYLRFLDRLEHEEAVSLRQPK